MYMEFSDINKDYIVPPAVAHLKERMYSYTDIVAIYNPYVLVVVGASRWAAS